MSSSNLLLFLQVLSALVLLWVGAHFLVRGASALALRVGISALAVGLTVVAFGTSAPELVVSAEAALAGASDIAIGNVVGSNISNVALILGLCALLRPTAAHPQVSRLDAPLLALASLAVAAMLAAGGLSRGAGALLVAGLVAYLTVTLRRARRETGPVKEDSPEGIPHPRSPLGVDVLSIAGGLLGLVVGGRLLVDAAVVMAQTVGVSQAVIGLTIVAIGTSLPELATSIVATARGHSDLAVGNVVGSNLFNLLGILGVAALVRPLPRGDIASLDLGVMVLLSLALWRIVRTGFVVSRGEGALLLASYVAYIGWRVVAS